MSKIGSYLGEYLGITKKIDPRTNWNVNPGVPGVFPRAWTDNRIDQVKAYKHWTYIAVNRIADKIASQMPNVGEAILVGKGEPKQYLESTHRKALTPISSHEDVKPVFNSHPLVRLLSDPNEPDTAYDLWYETILFLLLTGNSYWWIPKNKITGLPNAIWVLPAHWMWPIGGKESLVEGYELRPTEGNYIKQYYPADEIVHFRKKSPISKIDGYSPQSAGSQWIDTQLSVDRSRWFTMKNSAFPSTALEFAEGLDPSNEDLDRIEAKFMNRYAGETRAGKPLLLPPGVKFHKLSITPREMDFNQTSDQLRNSILALFGVPAVIAGIVDKMSGDSVLAAHGVFYSITINPLCRFLGQTITEKLARKYDDDLRVWWDDMTPEDPTNVEKQLQTDLSTGAITPNEIRVRRGRSPYVHGGDNPILPNLGIVLPYGDGETEVLVQTFDKPKTTSSKEEENQETEQEEELETQITGEE